MRIPAALLAMTQFAWAGGEKAGAFDYYLLSLSWSPTWCELVGDERGSPQCEDGRGHGWVLHGLWPQNERGWPSYCRTVARDPRRSETAGMADIMGSSGAAWYQWKKHGRCTGLAPEDYFETARRAYEKVNRPAVFRKLDDPVRLPARIVEEAFLQANPDWNADQITVTCKAGRIQEIRLCLTKELAPRTCGADVIRDCTLEDALLAPMR